MAEGGTLGVRGVMGPILVAGVADFVLNVALAPPEGRAGFAGRVLTFLLGALFAYLLGRWLGTRTWPKRGRKLARSTLRRTLRSKNAPLVFLTDRPDFRASIMRRTLEVVGFVAGSSVILVAVPTLLGAGGGILVGSVGLYALVAVWASFILVPYWMFGRMGLRQVDPVRWLVLPLSRRYADRLRLSNGALALLALGLVFNLAFRAGASRDAALVGGITAIAHVVALVLVIATTAVAYYARDENALVREFETEAVQAGLLDGRGMSDGDFLPRLPHG